MANAKVKVQENTAASDLDLNRVKPKKKLTPEEVEYMRQKDREMVRGIFRFFEVPGGTMGFSFKKYKGDEVESYSMRDGEIYTIPRGVAMHLSNACWYPESVHRMDEHNRIIAMVNKKKRRCSFEPLDFMSEDSLRELNPVNIETVTFLNQTV